MVKVATIVVASFIVVFVSTAAVISHNGVIVNNNVSNDTENSYNNYDTENDNEKETGSSKDTADTTYNDGTFRITYEPEDPRAEKKIFFWVDGPTQGWEITWDFDDGKDVSEKYSRGCEVLHVFNYSAYFDVTACLVKGVEKVILNRTLPVKNYDLNVVQEVEGFEVIPIAQAMGKYAIYELKNGITYPKVNISMTVYGAYGLMNPFLEITHYDDKGNPVPIEEDRGFYNGDIEKNYIYDMGDLIDQHPLPYDLDAGLLIYEGRCEKIIISGNIIY